MQPGIIEFIGSANFSQLTLADIAVFSVLESIVYPDDKAFSDIKSAIVDKRFKILDDFKPLKDNFEMVKKSEGIAKYLKTRKATPM